MTKKEKIKPVHKLIELYIKEFNSYFNNSNTQKPIKYHLRDYVNTLSNDDKYQLIFHLCDYIFREEYLYDKDLDNIYDKYN